jgi:hypothetical protein
MEGASAQTIEKSRAAAPDELPASYLQLLSATDGGEGPLPVIPFNLCLDPAHEVIARVSNGNYRQSEFDEFLIFGGNGAASISHWTCGKVRLGPWSPSTWWREQRAPRL